MNLIKHKTDNIVGRKPLILVSNDDGIHAPGLRFLIDCIRDLGKLVIVAPDRPMSGMGHAITLSVPLRFRKIRYDENYEEYSCNGTPVDCIKLARSKILTQKPDLCIAGINHGNNASINVIYSGTMAIALECALLRIPAIGFSLTEYELNATFEHARKYVRHLVISALTNGLDEGVCLNVNIPANSENEIKGIKVCRQADGVWDEEFDERIDPHGKRYYWMHGLYKCVDNGDDTDNWALENNFISVVPTKTDLTSHDTITKIKNWEI